MNGSTRYAIRRRICGGKAKEACEKAEKKWEECKQKLIEAMDRYNRAEADKERADAVLKAAMENKNTLEQEAIKRQEEFDDAVKAYAEALQAKEEAEDELKGAEDALNDQGGAWDEANDKVDEAMKRLDKASDDWFNAFLEGTLNDDIRQESKDAERAYNLAMVQLLYEYKKYTEALKKLADARKLRENAEKAMQSALKVMKEALKALEEIKKALEEGNRCNGLRVYAVRGCNKVRLPGTGQSAHVIGGSRFTRPASNSRRTLLN